MSKKKLNMIELLNVRLFSSIFMFIITNVRFAVYQSHVEHQQHQASRTLAAQQQQAAAVAAAPSVPIARAYGTPSFGGGGPGAFATAAIQPVDEEEPFEMTRRRQAATRFDRGARLVAELFAASCPPDVRTVVPQRRVDQLNEQVCRFESVSLA